MRIPIFALLLASAACALPPATIAEYPADAGTQQEAPVFVRTGGPIVAPGMPVGTAKGRVYATRYAVRDRVLVVSEDGGRTWTDHPASETGLDGDFFAKAVVQVGDTVWLTDEYKLYRSADGLHFTEAMGDLQMQMVTGIATDGTRLYVYGDGLARTSDGTHFTMLSQDMVSAVAALDGALLAATFGAGVVRSTDDGVTWQKTSLPAVGGFLRLGSSVIVIGEPGLYVSQDAGATWALANTNPPPFVGMAQLGRSKVVALDANGRLWETSGTGTWTERAGALPPGTGQMLLPTDDGALVAFSANSTFRLESDGAITEVGTDQSTPTILLATESALFAAPYQQAKVYRSDDGLGGWTSGYKGFTEYTAGMATLLEDGGALYAGTMGSHVMRSTDGGRSWKSLVDLRGDDLVGQAPIDALGVRGTEIVAGRNGGTWYASDGHGTRGGGVMIGGGLFRSANGGRTWSRIDERLPVRFEDGVYAWPVITAVTLPPGSKRIVAAVDATDSGVYVSDDSGLTWQGPASGLLSDGTTPVRRFVWADDVVFAVLDEIVYRSDDQGSSWNRAKLKLPSGAKVTDLAWDGARLFIATESKGVFASEDLGATTTAIGGALPGKVLRLAARPGQLSAGVQGAGVWSLALE